MTKKGKAMPAVLMDHEVNPKDALLERVGDLSEVEIFGNDVLVAIYQRPNRTKSGLYLTDDTVGEDRWQSKVGLVLKVGPTAYINEDDGTKFRDVKEGDWVVLRPSDGYPVQFSSQSAKTSRDVVPCRIVSDIHIRCRVSHPDLIY